jgi:hypothetical protein
VVRNVPWWKQELTSLTAKMGRLFNKAKREQVIGALTMNSLVTTEKLGRPYNLHQGCIMRELGMNQVVPDSRRSWKHKLAKGMQSKAI